MKVPPDGWEDDERDIPDDLARELSKMDGAPALPLKVLRAAGSGVLPEELEEAAQAYLSKDARARALVDELNETASLEPHAEARLYARISQQTHAGSTSRPGSRWQWRVAAAIGALAIAGSLWLLMTRDRDRAPAIAVTQSPPSAPANP